MKRRVLLASSIAGMTSISGCMGIFSGNEDKNKDESTTDTTDETDNDTGNTNDTSTDTNTTDESTTDTEDQEIELPHDELEPNSLSPNFLDTHIPTLENTQNYTIYFERVSGGGLRKTLWKRTETKAYSRNKIDSNLLEETHYEDGKLGVKTDNEESVEMSNQSLPSLGGWGYTAFIRLILEEGTFSLDSETESNVLYTGELQSEEADIQISISKERPIITEITLSVDKVLYEVKDINSTTIETPNWFTEAKK